MRLFIFNFKPLRWSIFFFIVLVVIFGSFKLWAITHAQAGLKPLPIQFWINKTFAPQVYDMVFIGDSRIYRGIAPSVIQQEFPQYKVLNFGYSSGGLTELLLQAGAEKLNPNGKKIIILGITPFSLTETAAFNEHYKGFKNTQAWPYRIPLLPLTLSPEESVWAVSHLFNTEKVEYYQIPHEDGWVESNHIPEDEEAGLTKYTQRFNKEKISAEVLKNLITQVKLWTQHGYILVGFRPPVSQRMEELENNKSGYNEQMIKQSFQDAGGLWIDVTNPYQYKTYDGSHLNSQSAIRFSVYIAHAIHQKVK